jgi:hypothetical protein
MNPFVYNALPTRVVFDTPAAMAIVAELFRLGCTRGLPLSTKEQAAARLAQSLGECVVGHFAKLPCTRRCTSPNERWKSWM